MAPSWNVPSIRSRKLNDWPWAQIAAAVVLATGLVLLLIEFGDWGD